MHSNQTGNSLKQAAIAMFLLVFAVIAVQGQDDEVLGSGKFIKKSEKLQGSFTIVRKSGKTILEIGADFKAKSGPDLQIVFSPLPFDETNGKNALTAAAISIGALKSNKGAQTYELPDDFDIDAYRCVLIHCVKYAHLWGGAAL